MSPAFLILLATLLPSPPVRALTLSEETDFSGSEIVQSLYADDEFGARGEDEDPPFDWNLSYSYQKTTTPNPGAADIVDQTQSLGLGLGWSEVGGLSVFGKLNYANTPEEKLTVQGAQVSGNYLVHYLKDDKPAGFSPYFNFKLIGAVNQYAAAFEGTTKRKKKVIPVSGSNRLGQELLGFGVSWRPLVSWRFDLEYDRYFFNRGIADFEARLDSAAAIQKGSSSFGNTIGVLADRAVIAGASWEFIKDWRFGISAMFARLALDQSASTAVKYQLSDQLTDAWKILVGVQRLESKVFSDTLGIVSAEFSN